MSVPHNARQLTCFSETKSTGEWAKDPRCLVDYEALNGRLKQGWGLEKAITTPYRQKNFRGQNSTKKNLPKIGDKFGKLELLELFKNNKYGNNNMWGKFKCECGNIKDVLLSSVISQKHTQSCGCYKSEINKTHIGQLNATYKHGDINSKLYNLWSNYKFKHILCQEWQDYKVFKLWAENNKYQDGFRLYRLDSSQSHNPSNSIFMLAGYGRERIFHIWTGMIYRCYNFKFKQYCNYGGRGIGVCNEWKNNYLLFRKWSLENGYKNNLSIDRIDNNWHFCPENCRWATQKQQLESKYNNRLILAFSELKTILHWSRDKRCIVSIDKFKQNLLSGFSPEASMQIV